MWDVIVRFITGFIISISGIWIVKNVSGTKDFSFNVKTFIWTVLLSIPSLFLYGVEYSMITPIITWLMYIVAIRRIFSFSWLESMIYSAIMLLLVAFVETILSFLFSIGYELDTLRENNFLKLMTTSIIAIGSILISKISWIKAPIYKITNKVESSKLIKILMFIIVSMFMVWILIYMIGQNFAFDEKFIISAVTIIVYLVLNYLYIKERNEYESLNQQYDALLTYVSEFSDWMETEQLKSHEHNNTLSKLRVKVLDNKDALDLIDEQLTVKFEVDKAWGEALKYIPNGSLKGLFFYKIVQANKRQINLVIDISKGVYESFQYINKKTEKIICYLFGIYTDNALEATYLTKEKNLGIEMYIRENIMHIIISNTFSDTLQLDQLPKKGYTTKGVGHGKGLYFAQKIIKSQKDIQEEHYICNNYYIEHLKIILK